MDKNYAQSVLEEFMSLPLSSSDGVFNKFKALPGAIYKNNGNKEAFLFVPGNRKDRIVLAAHADTVWDSCYDSTVNKRQKTEFRDGVYYGTNERVGIGADDRAGCAMLWCLRNSGHSLLILDGEEQGEIGSRYLKYDHPDIYKTINDHNYIVQLDRRGSSDYKTYFLPVSVEFKTFIENNTGYIDAGKYSFTDIVVLCDTVCGVNLSVGYYNEHHPNESLVFDEWFNTLSIVERMIQGEQKRFDLLRC